VKLNFDEYKSWALGRRDRDLFSTAKGRQAEASKLEAEKPKEAKEDDGKAKEDGEAAEEVEKPDADAEDAPKSREDNPAKEREGKKPYVDRQLEKALAVIKEKLATPVAKK
jgi:carboxyl-terminal processing protease